MGKAFAVSHYNSILTQRQNWPLRDTPGKETDFLLNHFVLFKLISRMKVFRGFIYLGIM